MQVDCVHRADIDRYWGAGTAPVFEIIAALDPFHRRDEWDDLRSRYGDRVTSVVIDDASHALSPNSPTRSPPRSSATSKRCANGEPSICSRSLRIKPVVFV